MCNVYIVLFTKHKLITFHLFAWKLDMDLLASYKNQFSNEDMTMW